MKMFIVREENGFKILRVDYTQLPSFKEEYKNKIIASGNNLQEVIKDFDSQKREDLHLKAAVSSFKNKEAMAEDEKQSIRQKQRL